MLSAKFDKMLFGQFFAFGDNQIALNYHHSAWLWNMIHRYWTGPDSLFLEVLIPFHPEKNHYFACKSFAHLHGNQFACELNQLTTVAWPFQNDQLDFEDSGIYWSFQFSI